VAKWRLFDYKCPCCGQEDKDIMLDVNEEDPDNQYCSVCKEGTERIYQAPMVLQASYPDGHKRPGFAAEREANKLKIASYDMPPKERAEINAEISKVKKGGAT
jgi:hypothetical protein